MMIYLDKDGYCHAEQSSDTVMAVETSQFDGMCPAYVEGFRYTPDDRFEAPEGTNAHYGAFTPWKPYEELVVAQRVHEKQLLAEYEAVIDELYSEVTAE